MAKRLWLPISRIDAYSGRRRCPAACRSNRCTRRIRTSYIVRSANSSSGRLPIPRRSIPGCMKTPTAKESSRITHSSSSALNCGFKGIGLTQSEEPQDCQYYDDKTDDINEAIHGIFSEKCRPEKGRRPVYRDFLASFFASPYVFASCRRPSLRRLALRHAC